MSAIGTTLGPSLGGVLIAGPGWRFIFLVNVPLSIVNVLLAHRYLPVDRREPKTDWAGFDTVGTLLIALNPWGLCPGHDDWARPVRSAEHGSAIGYRKWSRPLRIRRDKAHHRWSD
jgi:MFS family permease